MENNTLQMSAGGMAALRAREGAVMHYYNDLANHCTYGIGTLAHHGPCTAEELRTPITITQVHQQLATAVNTAESAVRRGVTKTPLTQAQFDALVSYTYNVGVRGAAPVLRAANEGNKAQVIKHMEQTVYVHPRDAQGRRLQARRVPGLVNRRKEEAGPFRDAGGKQP